MARISAKSVSKTVSALVRAAEYHVNLYCESFAHEMVDFQNAINVFRCDCVSAKAQELLFFAFKW